jgi:inhibitor of cysteine peptidase
METVTITDQANGSEVQFTAGQTFRIALPCSPSTGYSWKLENSPGPELKLLSSGMVESSGQLGGKEAQEFVFETMTSGSKDLKFNYVRPWETAGTSSAESFTVRVRVEPATPAPVID